MLTEVFLHIQESSLNNYGTSIQLYHRTWRCRDDAVDYVKVLEDNGWEIESTYSDEEDYYCMILKKDQVYSIVKYEEYEGAYMLVGFSDMIENLTW